MPDRINDCTLLIVAGGESSRMGQDKATLPFMGKPLVDTLASRLQPLFAHLLISVRTPRSDINWPQVCDDSAVAGPLAGLDAGLRACKTPWLFAIAVDMPFLDQATIAHLAGLRAEHDAVVPCADGQLQPLAAFYSVSRVRTQLATLLARHDGRRSLRALLEQLNVCQVDSGLLVTDQRAFIDLDTPEDVQKHGLCTFPDQTP